MKIISILPYFFILCFIIFLILGIDFRNKASKLISPDGVQSEQEKHFRSLSGIFTLLWVFSALAAALAYGVAVMDDNLDTSPTF